MPLTPDDIDALRTLLREELATKDEFSSLRDENAKEHRMISLQLDGLAKRLETLDQEYQSLKHQVKKLEAA